MQNRANERRTSTRISFTNQPRLMLKNAQMGSFSATLVDLCADGMCLDTDATYPSGTNVKAYFPDHRGPTIKARVIRTWQGGLALIMPDKATRKLRRFTSRLLEQDHHAAPIVLKRETRLRNRAADGLVLIGLSFLTALGLLAWQVTPQTSGLASLVVMLGVLAGGCLLDKCSLNQGAVRRTIALGLSVFFVGILSSAAPSSSLIQAAYDKLWILALSVFGLYFISRPFEAYLAARQPAPRPIHEHSDT